MRFLLYNGWTLRPRIEKGAAVAEKKEEIEIPLVLEKVLSYCLKDAKERMEKGEAVLPFSAKKGSGRAQLLSVIESSLGG